MLMKKKWITKALILSGYFASGVAIGLIATEAPNKQALFAGVLAYILFKQALFAGVLAYILLFGGYEE
jgi:hypothetical protein